MLDLQSSHDVFQVAKKIRELMADSEHMDVLHESHDIFKREQDEQLVQWMNRSVCQKQEMVLCASDSFHVQFLPMPNVLINVCCRRPDDWTLSAGGSGTIYGWGHNHRGQLGGIEGAKVKVPTPCEALATLRPVQLIGGEQTLFAVTADGKVEMRFLCPAVGRTELCIAALYSEILSQK